MKFTLKIWRQKDAKSKGAFQTYQVDNISPDTSFLEMLDILNNDLVHKGAKTIYNCHIKSVEYVDNIVRFHLYNPILGYVLDKGSGYKISEIKTVYTSLNSIFYALQEDEEYSWLGRYICEIWENQKLLNSIFIYRERVSTIPTFGNILLKNTNIPIIKNAI